MAQRLTPLVFARLKVRLLRNGMRGRAGRAAAFWLGAAAGAVGGLLLFIVLASAPEHGEGGHTTVVLTFVGLWVAWAIVPLLAFGADETLDPARLALLPLTRRQVMTGLLAASAVGIVPAACMAGLAGAVVIFGRSPMSALLVTAAVLLLLALCLATARALTTGLSQALRSRRWRDITMVVLSLLGLAIGWGRFLVGDLVDRLGDDVPVEAAAVLQWTPPGLLGRAVIGAGDGAVAEPVAIMAVAAWAIVAALGLWWRALDRMTASAAATAGRRAQRGLTSLFPRALPFLPRTRAGAVAAKDLRYLWRDPRGRSQLVSAVPLALGLPIFWAASSDAGGEVVLFATSTAVLVGLNQMNMFGLDGEALWMNVVAGFHPRADLVGKALTAATVAIATTTVSAVVLAALTGGWRWLPLALALGVGVVGVMVGIGSVFSVRAPVPLADSKGNLFAGSGAGTGCITSLVLMSGYLLQAVCFAPVGILVAIGLGTWAPALVIAGVVAPVYGWLIWRAGVAIASEWAAEHWPELLDGVTPKRA